MRKLYKNIILFLLPVLILIILLPVNERSKFIGLKDDCFNHGIWIHDRIFNNKKSVDIAFFGSSKTINGINDELIEKELSTANINIVNFGYCRLGQNFSLSLIKKILKNKQPKQLIFEVREDEDRYSHPIFPYIASTSEVILANPFFNRDILSDVYTHLSYKIELTQDYLYQEGTNTPFSSEHFGFASSPDTASIEYLQNIKSVRNNPKSELTIFERDFHMQFSRTYLKRIHRICSRKNIEITFLYIPSFGSPIKIPKEIESYKKYGRVLFPPEEIFEDPSNWHDEDHLNQTGAEKLSFWIAKEIQNGLP